MEYLHRLWNRREADDAHDRYDRWVRDYGAELYRVAYRMCGDATTAEELVQETFYHGWKGMNQLRDQERARAWLFQILRRRYTRWVRDRNRRVTADALPLSAADSSADRESDPLARLADRDALQAALNTLEDRFKIPFLMVFMEGLTCQETADRLDIPLGTVLSRTHRARRRLRQALAEQDAADSARDTDQPRLRLGGDA